MKSHRKRRLARNPRPFAGPASLLGSRRSERDCCPRLRRRSLSSASRPCRMSKSGRGRKNSGSHSMPLVRRRGVLDACDNRCLTGGAAKIDADQESEQSRPARQKWDRNEKQRGSLLHEPGAGGFNALRPIVSGGPALDQSNLSASSVLSESAHAERSTRRSALVGLLKWQQMTQLALEGSSKNLPTRYALSPSFHHASPASDLHNLPMIVAATIFCLIALAR